MKEAPSYYAILTADVRYNKNLKPMEKLMYAEITALSNKNGYCTASNSYFSELYGTAKETVSRWISSLEKEGLVSVDLVYEGKQVTERRITLLTKISIPIDEKVNTPIDEKVKDNNTSNNNILGDFETFWKAYPNKKGKANALAAWKRKKPNLKTVLDALNKQKQSTEWTKDNGKYIPHGSTYVNGQRWEDEVQYTSESDKGKYTW